LQGLVQFLAEKFHVDQNQLQSAVNDYHTQHKQQLQQKLQDKENAYLDYLISQGKITTAQKQQIIAERSKLQSEYNPVNFKTLTPDQRKQQLQKEQAEIQTWSKDTGIDAKYLRFGHMRMFPHGNNSVSPTATPSI
jgi:hypothetical protein